MSVWVTGAQRDRQHEVKEMSKHQAHARRIGEPKDSGLPEAKKIFNELDTVSHC